MPEKHRQHVVHGERPVGVDGAETVHESAATDRSDEFALHGVDLVESVRRVRFDLQVHRQRPVRGRQGADDDEGKVRFWCGCLSMARCAVLNPEDEAAARGPGTRFAIEG